MTVSGSSSSVTPRGGGDRVEGDGVADHQRRDVVVDRVRDVGGERLDRELARHLFEHAALLDAGRVLCPGEIEHDGGADRHVEPDPEHVDVDRVAGHRVARDLLDHDRNGSIAADAQLEHRAGVGKRVPQQAGVDVERDRVLATAVDHAGHVALAAQPARRPRSGRLATLD